jgi:putative phosphoesterase
MKIGILSDTHDNMNAIRKAVEFFNQEGVAHVLHAGDIISPFTMNEFGKLKMPLSAVFGNNDGEKPFLRERIKGIGEISEGHFEKVWEGKRLIVMHEPKLVEELKQGGDYDVIIYGHTHKVDIREGRPLILNPGEAGGWLTGKYTVALLELPSLEVKIVELPK